MQFFFPELCGCMKSHFETVHHGETFLMTGFDGRKDNLDFATHAVACFR